jgi:hypothetical protein
LWFSIGSHPPTELHPPPQEAQSLGLHPPAVNSSLILYSSFFLIYQGLCLSDVSSL